MVPLTRRRFLQGAVGLAAGLSGCNGVEGLNRSTQTSSPTVGHGDSDRSTDSTTTPETTRVRVADSRPPIWLTDPERDDGRPTRGDDSRLLSSVIVDSQSRADRVEIVDVPAAEDARSFIASTSFDRETVYIQNHRVKDCFRLDLCHASWRSTTVETDYARLLLPYDERCAANDWAAESWLIRIPAALSENDVNGYSTSVGSAACDQTAGPGGATGERGSTGEQESTETADTATPTSHTTSPDPPDTDGDR
jgi:hypothetical protein